MVKRIAIVQSCYIPWKGYFDLINLADEFILLDDVQFTRRDWRNRNIIKTAAGPKWLTIPVEAKGRFAQKIKDVRISGSEWRAKHWKTIQRNYARASHFREFAGIFEELYLSASETSLSLTNLSFMKAVCSILGIRTKLSFSMDYGTVDGKTERLVDLCRKTGASEYISGPSAKGYIDESLFEKEGLSLTWMDYGSYPEYPQPHPPFDHHVSVLDLIFNAGSDAPRFMLSFGKAKGAGSRGGCAAAPCPGPGPAGGARAVPVDETRLMDHQRTGRTLTLPHAGAGHALAHWASETPDRAFCLFPGSRIQSWTFREAEQAAASAQKFLRESGVARGDRLCVLLPNSPEFVAMYFAALGAGITFVPINPDLSPREAAYILGDSGARVLVHSEGLGPKAAESAALAEGVVLACSGQVPGVGVPCAGIAPLFETSGGDLYSPAVVIYTSGTTGNPKGAVLSQMNIVADAAAIAGWMHFDQTTRSICILPMFHNNGQIVTLMAPLCAGGSTIVLEGKVSLLSFWGVAAKHGASWTSVMPSILSILLRHRRPGDTQAALKGVICGGQVLIPQVQADFEAAFGVPVFEGFGLTETTSFACFNDFPASARVPGSVGRPLPVNDMGVFDDEGNPVPPGAEGEICIRGINVASGYIGLPEVNARAFRKGWFHSGDFGTADADGRFRFLCRKDFLIKKGGENIYPAELENVLFAHPAVADCAVIGIPHPLLGEDLCAFVRLKEGFKTAPDEIRGFCGGRIAPFKIPARIVAVNDLPDLREIPKGPTQKILYRKLKEYYLAHLA